MWSKKTDGTHDAVHKVLGEPVSTGLSDRAWKVRTQLIAVSVVGISLVGFGLHITPNGTLFGFSLSGLTDQLVRRGLIVWIGYLLSHFVWMAWEGFAEWRLRLTGTRVVAVTVGTFGSEESDYPTDPRQSTLANWWRNEATRIGSLTELLRALEHRAAKQEATINEACAGKEPLNVAIATAPLREIVNSIAQLKVAIEQTAKVLASPRIPASLDRFEKAYVRFLQSQNLRWLFFDVLLPIIVAIVSLWYLMRASIL